MFYLSEIFRFIISTRDAFIAIKYWYLNWQRGEKVRHDNKKAIWAIEREIYT